VKPEFLILIGAARSGTKLLRDLVARHPDIDRVPYDVNYIWKMGNEDIPHDELPIERLTPEKRNRILNQLYHFADSPVLIEKTVQNCVRVPFVHSALPDARFIHLIRDGIDVVESSYREWTAPPKWRYILNKARTFPLRSAFGYALSYARDTVRRLLAYDRTRTSVTWGPRYQGIDADVTRLQLIEVCAIQWVQSVVQTLHGLDNVPPENVLTIRYEELVSDPDQHLKEIARFVEVNPTFYDQLDLGTIVTTENVGKGKRTLDQDRMDLVLPHMIDTLSLLGYR
jgi:hypothetical protein